MLKRLKTWVVNKKETIKLSFENLSSNQLCDWDNVFETALTPLFWFVDNYASKLGTSFVILCCLIMGTVVAVSYWIGLPFWWQKSPTTTIFLLLFGNWLMVNCFFHYYMGILCGPGFPPEDTFYEYVAGICKKCIQVKPHRTHHCSVCNTCILLMDHHCPWLNNCVGHYNRRYFYLFMAYIEISVIFLIIFGVEIAYNEVWLSYISEDQDLYGYPVQVNTSLPREEWIVKPTTTESDTIISEERYKSMRRRAIIFTSIVCLGVAIAIGTLLYGHTRIISKGETSIEKHINETQKKIYTAKNQIYINPYDFGLYKNWTLFLGIENDSGRTWFHVLFPSAHKPFGDGIVWPTIASTEQEWKDFFHHKHR